MTCRDLKSLNPTERKSFLDSFDEVLCDCDGVLWLMKEPILGSPKAVQKLRSLGKKIRFVSNNCIYTYDQFYMLLEKLGYGNEKDSLVIPTMAIINHLKNIKFDREIFLLGSAGLRTELENEGYKMAPKGPGLTEIKLPEIIETLKDNPNVGAVIVELDVNLNYINLMLASIYLKRKDVILLNGGSDKICPFSKDLNFIGPHYFQVLLEEFSGTKALHFAKPKELLAKYACDKYKIKDPKRVLFVGDTLEQDMKFASVNGFQKLLVFSGAVSKEELEKNKCVDLNPDYCLDTFGSIVDIVNSTQ
ncbi:unnamed protein product [Brassicogethes aeneus]|uniref:4-nitrophenylphosphatase n=1 Tax=Brassicogethes aeneus TaxID=1431903 RepID=A0A9P0BJ77_BRAAE|nr:unnamed protein product [Brassicogethes aeneus]